MRAPRDNTRAPSASRQPQPGSLPRLWAREAKVPLPHNGACRSQAPPGPRRPHASPTPESGSGSPDPQLLNRGHAPPSPARALPADDRGASSGPCPRVGGRLAGRASESGRDVPVSKVLGRGPNLNIAEISWQLGVVRCRRHPKLRSRKEMARSAEACKLGSGGGRAGSRGGRGRAG